MAERPPLLRRLARALAYVFRAGHGRLQHRTYAAARQSRLSVGLGSSGNSSADAELATSLTRLRAASRQLVRDAAYAKRAKVIVVNNVVGHGVGMQAQVLTTRGDLNVRINDDIERAWHDWMRAGSCHTGRALHFHDLERAALGQVFEAGEAFIRIHWSRVGDSAVPLALELVEAERLADEVIEPGALAADADMRMGVEVDRFGGAVAYWIRRRHPGDLRSRVDDRYERVPAQDVIHLRIIDRWPQTRGEPWLHAVVRKLDDMNEYSTAEVSAARASAYYFATVRRPEVRNTDAAALAATEADKEGADAAAAARPAIEIEPLMVEYLDDGEQLDFHAPNRPNTALDPFMRAMLREIAAGTGPSYESLSRDYSQSNYSSSRLSLLDDRDLWRVLQHWWIRNFRERLHGVWLQQAVLAGAIPSLPVTQYAGEPRKYSAVLFKPRGWSWVDPTKEVTAYKEAVKGGMTTLTDVIAATAGGQDIEDVIATRKREVKMFADAGIALDTDPRLVGNGKAAVPPAPEEETDTDDAAPKARVVSLAR